MKNILFIIPLLLFSNFTLLCQSGFYPGYVINSDLDTLYGLIESQGEIKNSKACKFKKNEKAGTRIFNPEDLFAYRFNSGKYYVSKEIELDGESHQVFLEFLINGIYNLYYTNYLGKERYFLENEQGRLSELSNELIDVYQGATQYTRNSNQYIGVLKASFSDYPDLFPEIEKAELNHNSLIKLIKDYHKFVCKDEECIVYEKQVAPMKLRIGPSLGVHFLKLKYQEETEEFISDFGSNYFIGVLARIEFPRRNNKFSLEFSSDFAKLYFYKLTSTRNTFTDYHIYMNQVKTKIAPRFSIPISKLKIGFFAGIQFDNYFNFEGKTVKESVFGNIVTTNYSPYEVKFNSQFGYFGGIGVDYTLKKRIIYLNTIIEFIPIKTKIIIDSQLLGLSLSTGILF